MVQNLILHKGVNQIIIRDRCSSKYKKSVIITMQKRTFMRAARQIMFHQERQFQAQITKRNMATWAVCSRIEQPVHGHHLPLPVDPETGLEIMSSVDYSGKNHYFLSDQDFKSELYYKIYGTFTTKSTFYKNIPPLMVSPYTLEGQNTPQFFHQFTDAKLILKSDVAFDDLITYSLSYPEYKEFLKNIKP